MSIIQFSHANGFPAKTYTALFDHLKEHKISAINILAENTNPNEINWYDMRDDVLENIEQQGEAVIGIGHSFGGVLTLLAAAKKPELFQSIILLDPASFFSTKKCIDQVVTCLEY